MAKGKKQQSKAVNEENKPTTLADQLGGDVLAKLKQTKKSLEDKEQQEAEERRAKAAFEKKQREKNMSFEELLNLYGDKGSKF